MFRGQWIRYTGGLEMKGRMGKVSIIVPVYNVKNYLRRCADSIKGQTYKEWELILVDDGSTDGSGKLCNEIEKESERIKVVHQQNGGLSCARNSGIRVATGDYLMFIDSDDFIDRQYVEKHIVIAEQENADLVISDLIAFYEGNPLTINSGSVDSITHLSRKEALKEGLLQRKMDVSACAKLYKRELFEQIRFPEGELYEDFAIFYQIVFVCNNIIYMDYRGYYYLQRDGSIMHSGMSVERMKLIENSKKILMFCSKMDRDIYEAALYRYVVNHYQILKISINEQKYDRLSRELRKNIMGYFVVILMSPLVAKRTKLATFILWVGIKPYRLSRKLYEKLAIYE